MHKNLQSGHISIIDYTQSVQKVHNDKNKNIIEILM